MTFVIPRILPGSQWHNPDDDPEHGAMVYEHEDGHFHTDTGAAGGSIIVSPTGVLQVSPPSVDPLVVRALWVDTGGPVPILKISTGP